MRKKESYTGAGERGESPLHPVSVGCGDTRVDPAKQRGRGGTLRVGTRKRPGQAGAGAGASVPGLAHLFHLDLLVVDLFKVEDLGGGFDHLTGGRRGGRRSGGGCRHDPLRNPGGQGRLPPGQSGGDPRPPASGPTFSLEPRRSVAGTGAAATAESRLRLRCVFLRRAPPTKLPVPA